nr:DUF4384 domain-containing protein [uncultured Prevotella sp.]
MEKAKQTALDRAKIQLIANEFGTIVSQSNSTSIKNDNGKSEIDFISVGGSEVRGEWIETIGTPQYKISYEQNMLVVNVFVKGRIREITSAKIDIKAKVLRNGIEDKFESKDFNNGDDLYLSFVSPVNGFLAVYLVDTDQKAYCLLPYRSQTDGIYKIEANCRYLFFSIKNAPRQEQQYVDEYVMTCNRSPEQNQIYIVFSPIPFVKATDNSLSEVLPRELGFKDFITWVSKCKTSDKELQALVIPIVIKQ